MHSDTLIINPTACFSTCAALPVSAQSVFIRCAVLHAVVLFLVPDPLQLAFYSWNNLPLPVFFQMYPPFNLTASTSSCPQDFCFVACLSKLKCKRPVAGQHHLLCVCKVMCILAVLSKNKCGIKLIISFPFEAEHNKSIACFLTRPCKPERFTQCCLPNCLAALRMLSCPFLLQVGAHSQSSINLHLRKKNLNALVFIIIFNRDSWLRKRSSFIKQGDLVSSSDR